MYLAKRQRCSADLLKQQLYSEDPVKRIEAIQKIAESRNISVIDQLTTAMDDRHPDVRQAAVDALASFRPDILRSPLLAHSKNFFRVANKLDAAAIPILLENLKNDDQVMCEEAVSYLVGAERTIIQLRTTQEKAIPALATALHDSN